MDAEVRPCDAAGDAAGAFNLGVLLVRRGLLADGERAFRRADEAGDPTAASNLGVLLEKRGDQAGAEAAYRRADKRGHADGAFNLGLLLERRGDLAGAIEAFRHADERGDAAAASNLGVLLDRRGDQAGAEAAYRRADERGDADGAFNLGLLLERRHDVSGAAEAFRRAAARGAEIDLSESPPPPVPRAEVLATTGAAESDGMNPSRPTAASAHDSAPNRTGRREPETAPLASAASTKRVLALGVAALMFAGGIAFGTRSGRDHHRAKADPPRSTARITRVPVAAAVRPRQPSQQIVNPGRERVRKSTRKTATHRALPPSTHPAGGEKATQRLSKTSGAADSRPPLGADPATNQPPYRQSGGAISAGIQGSVPTGNQSTVPRNRLPPATGGSGSTNGGPDVATSPTTPSASSSGTSTNGSAQTGTGTTSGGG